MNKPLVKVENLNVVLNDGTPLLKDVSFDIQHGETFAFLGESGSGKSLTALSIARLLGDNIRFRSGKVWFDGQDLLQLSELEMQRIRGRRMAFIFQEPMTAMNPVMTAGRQITEVLRLHRKMSSADAKQTAFELLADVGLFDSKRVFTAYPHELSGGMKQRVMIAMALAGDPDLLIADEPTTALDVTVQAQVLELLRSLQSKIKMTLLFISHDLSLVSNIADRLAVMQAGRIVDITETRLFFQQPKHQYSRHLIDVIPTIDKRGKSLSGKALLEQREPDTSADDTLLEVRDLKVYFPVRSGLFNRTASWVKAVDGVSLSLTKGQTLAIVGESGSGKTTVAKAILRLVDPYDGSIHFAGRRIDTLRRSDLRTYKRKVQMVWQDPFSSLNPKMQIGELIKEGMYVQNSRQTDGQMTERVIELLSEVGFSADIVNRYPHEFSGGQRQRLCIARALAVEPELLICDEPTSALDVSVQAQILDLFQDLQRRHGLSYLFITHDIAIVSYMAHTIAVMNKGEIVEYGSAVSVLNAPQQAYTQVLLSSVPVLRTA